MATPLHTAAGTLPALKSSGSDADVLALTAAGPAGTPAAHATVVQAEFMAPTADAADTTAESAGMAAGSEIPEPSPPLVGGRPLVTLVKEAVEGWGNVATAPDAEFRVWRLTGGMTNTLWVCQPPTQSNVTPSGVVVRLFGDTSGLVIQDWQRAVAIAAGRAGIAPALLAFAGDFQLEEYVNATTLRPDQLRQELLEREAIPAVLAKFHSLTPERPGAPGRAAQPVLQGRLREWLTILNEKLAVGAIPDDAADTIRSMRLDEHVEMVLRQLDGLRGSVVLTHNDLQPGNWLRYTDGRLLVIDFEYAMYNFREYDYANMFCEAVYDYNVTSAPYFQVLPHRAYTRAQQRVMLKRYKEASGLTDSLQDMLHRVHILMIAAHLHWALWGATLCDRRDISFGYLEHAQSRLALLQGLMEADIDAADAADAAHDEGNDTLSRAQGVDATDAEEERMEAVPAVELEGTTDASEDAVACADGRL